MTRQRWLEFGIGAAACVAIASISMTTYQFTAVPAVLAALVIGMATRRSGVERYAAGGIDFCARTLLRIGVALIGARLSITQVMGLGWHVAAIAVGAVCVTLVGGTIVARIVGLTPARSLLSAGSVGICGASAALAVSAVLPNTPERQRETVFTIAAVTTLSTVVMVAYPLLSKWLGLNDVQAGVFFGTAIHDVTQVIGAGALVSPEATVTATATKLIRVACLAPAAALIGLWIARSPRNGAAGAAPPLLPGFLIGFIAIAAAANSGVLGPAVIDALAAGATFCLVTATAALGLKTSIHELTGAGWRPLVAIVAQTLLIGTYALAAVWWMTGSAR
ncbi:YeiH family protein [Sphingopyxis sp.]|uniref:YeiH family protein n=1 Tax=Sphingopyxis sp. TaxID=1908224 RepID=UPI003D6D1FA8